MIASMCERESRFMVATSLVLHAPVEATEDDRLHVVTTLLVLLGSQAYGQIRYVSFARGRDVKSRVCCTGCCEVARRH